MILTIPNVISMIRIALIPFFLWLLLGARDPVAAAWVIGPIGATDWVDGYLARRLHQVSELGKFLDPAADRLAVAAAVIGGWISGFLPWPVALAIIVRESVVVVGALVLGLRARSKLDVRYLGKVATFGIYWAIPFFLLHAGTGWAWQEWLAWGLAVPSLVLYYIVAAQYVGDMRRVLARVEPVSSDD
jgi:cardiolipin synthase